MNISTKNFAAIVLAIGGLAFAMLPACAQQSDSKYSNATIIVATTAEGEDGLHFSTGNCSGTLSGVGILLDFGDSGWAWNTQGDVPRSLFARMGADKISFRHNGENYVITDAATVKRARDIFAPAVDIMKQQQELGAKQRALGEKQRDLGRQQREVKVAVPDMSADFAKVETDAKRLATQGGTQSDLGDLQSTAGEAQSKLGDAQSVLGDEQSQLGDQQSALGEKTEGLAKDEVKKLNVLLDDAVRNGTAKKSDE